ncbi:MAG: hypothetical protein KGJ57_16120 [Sphingomonadales bacterium]|nr:hypothetical protein [Sphingomonadales bacterium]MDE2170930.1 hypothetical protein [Sphingomonadales bacterium]
MLTMDKRGLLLGAMAGGASLRLPGQPSVALGTAQPALPVERGAARPDASLLDLLTPPSAQTSDSIAILWSKPGDVTFDGYEIYLDDRLTGTTSLARCSYCVAKWAIAGPRLI